MTPVVAVADRRPVLVAVARRGRPDRRAADRRFLPGAPIAIVERTIRDWPLRYGAYDVDGLSVWGATARILSQLGRDPRGLAEAVPRSRPRPIAPAISLPPMTTRILLRSPKSPFETIIRGDRRSARTFIGHNSGNLVFLETAWKLLDTRDAEMTPDRFAAYKMGADEINERFDVYVIPLANAFRATFGASLGRLTKVIEGLEDPGRGPRCRRSSRRSPTSPACPAVFDDGVKAFVKAVLDRSASIGVRGEYTQDYLQKLGFRDVEVIGCPSMYLRGDQLSVTKKVPA